MQESVVRCNQTDMNVESRLEVISDLTFIIHSKHLSQDDELPANWHRFPVNDNDNHNSIWNVSYCAHNRMEAHAVGALPSEHRAVGFAVFKSFQHYLSQTGKALSMLTWIYKNIHLHKVKSSHATRVQTWHDVNKSCGTVKHLSWIWYSIQHMKKNVFVE